MSSEKNKNKYNCCFLSYMVVFSLNPLQNCTQNEMRGSPLCECQSFWSDYCFCALYLFWKHVWPLSNTIMFPNHLLVWTCLSGILLFDFSKRHVCVIMCQQAIKPLFKFCRSANPLEKWLIAIVFSVMCVNCRFIRLSATLSVWFFLFIKLI